MTEYQHKYVNDLISEIETRIPILRSKKLKEKDTIKLASALDLIMGITDKSGKHRRNTK